MNTNTHQNSLYPTKTNQFPVEHLNAERQVRRLNSQSLTRSDKSINKDLILALGMEFLNPLGNRGVYFYPTPDNLAYVVPGKDNFIFESDVKELPRFVS